MRMIQEQLVTADPPNYDEGAIQFFEGTEHVRRRPAMYIGDVGVRGLHHLVYEVVDNSIDEAMAGFCRNITVVIRKNGAVSVEDDGRGIPVGFKKEYGMTALEMCLTKVGAGGKFDRNSYKVSGGLHGVGVSCVNALSESCLARVQRDGKVWEIGFERGKTTRPIEALRESDRTGTYVEFKPDPTIFTELTFQYNTLANRLRELAYLNAGLRIVLKDERDGREDAFCFDRGIVQFVEHLNEGKNSLHGVVLMRVEDPEQRLIVEAAFQYTDGYNETTLSFANNINTVEGGTHLSGFRAALTRAMNNYARKMNLYKANDPAPTGEDIREGVTAIVSVMVPEPQFEGQTKTKLGNSEVGTFVETAMNDRLATYFEETPAEAKRIVSKAVQAAQAREAARKARETARKSAMSGAGMSRKLVDCSSRDVGETELFIVEGDSAAGSAKGHRDAKTQAILPIRGKILNVEKARLHKVLSHEEIIEIIRSIGTGIGADDFDAGKARYGRIILMTDADVDGSHIRTLLLTFFYRHLRGLIDEGFVYIAQPPLYQLKKGKTVEYVLDDPQLHERLLRIGLQGARLEVARAGQPPRFLEQPEVATLLSLLERIEAQARILRRRGIPEAPFMRDQLREGRLPAYRLQWSDGEAFAYDAAEAERISAPHADGAVVETELPEAGELEECYRSLREFGLTPADLFLKREELVTGDRSPAVFILHLADGDPVELDNVAELPSGIRGAGSRGWEIKRFKGLGEMNKDELWSTTMDPANRVLLKVVVGDAQIDAEQTDIDAVEADRVFSILMGEDVEKRREFIETNAIHAKNLDI